MVTDETWPSDWLRDVRRAHWRHDTHEHNGDRTMKRSERLAARRYTLEREVAPHVEPEWAEAMLLELRLLGVDGARIGAALAPVGEAPQEQDHADDLRRDRQRRAQERTW